jgi:hypothetical protein
VKTVMHEGTRVGGNWPPSAVRATSPNSSSFTGCWRELSVCLFRYNAMLDVGAQGGRRLCQSM